MTFQELTDFTSGILGGETIEPTFFEQLINQAKDTIEGLRNWQFLRASISLGNTTSSDNYLTTHALPSTFLIERKVYVNGIEFDPIPFEERELYKDTSGFYYIDYANATLALTGRQNDGQEIIVIYQKKTSDIDSTHSWGFPTQYHKLLGFYVAAYFQGGIDLDDINVRMAPENREQAGAILKSMVNWDARLQLKSSNNVMAKISGYEKYPRDGHINMWE